MLGVQRTLRIKTKPFGMNITRRPPQGLIDPLRVLRPYAPWLTTQVMVPKKYVWLATRGFSRSQAACGGRVVPGSAVPPSEDDRSETL